MVHFGIINGNVEGNTFEHTLAGHETFKNEMQGIFANPDLIQTVDFVITDNYTEQQLLNFLALLQKSWFHFVTFGLRRSSEIHNPWGPFKRGGLAAVEELFQTGPVSFSYSDGVARIAIKFFEGRHTAAEVCAIAWRLCNLAEWVEKFGDQFRLTGSKRLKWKSFNEITMSVTQTLNITPKASRFVVRPPGAGYRTADERVLSWERGGFLHMNSESNTGTEEEY